MLILLCFILIVVSLGDFALNILHAQRNLSRLRSSRQKFLSNNGTHEDVRFLILVPLFCEQDLVESIFNNYCEAYGSRQDCEIVFITSIKEIELPYKGLLKASIENQDFATTIISLSTPGRLHEQFCLAHSSGCLPSNLFHVINTDELNTKKYAQLTFGLTCFEKRLRPTDYVGVYDADSIPDSSVLDYIQLRTGQSVFQQIPLYPPSYPIASSSELFAQARIMHNIQYLLSVELTEYLRPNESGQPRLGWHLIGHGEFIRLDALDAAGRFLPPSCDSTLGFSLGLTGHQVHPIPIVDISQTPRRLSDIFWQGVVWYNGVSLFPREGKRLKVAHTLNYYLSYIRIFNDHLRWGFYPFVILTAIILLYFIALPYAIVMSALILFVNVAQDMCNYANYSELVTWSSLKPVKKVSLLAWLKLSIAFFAVTRWVWASVPLYVVVTRLLRKELHLQKTPR